MTLKSSITDQAGPIRSDVTAIELLCGHIAVSPTCENNRCHALQVKTPPLTVKENSSDCCVNNRISSSENPRGFFTWFCLQSSWGQRAASSFCFDALTFVCFLERSEGEQLQKNTGWIFYFFFLNRLSVKSVKSTWLKSVIKDMKTYDYLKKKFSLLAIFHDKFIDCLSNSTDERIPLTSVEIQAWNHKFWVICRWHCKDYNIYSHYKLQREGEHFGRLH